MKKSACEYIGLPVATDISQVMLQTLIMKGNEGCNSLLSLKALISEMRNITVIISTQGPCGFEIVNNIRGRPTLLEQMLNET